MKVLLLNPPFDRKVIRGNYCSSEPKARYLYPPADLILLSGMLDRHHRIEVIDAIAEVKTEQEVLKHVSQIRPDAVIFVTSTLTHRSDFRFLESMREYHENVLMIGTGDLLLRNPQQMLQNNKWLDAVITDFTSPDILDYLNGQTSTTRFVINRNSVEQPCTHRKAFGDLRNKRSFKIGTPRHDLFPTYAYRLSHGRRNAATLTMLSFGCPYTCTFCPMERIVYKSRSIDEALLEMRRISEWRIREVFFLDQTFGVNVKETVEFCQRLADEKLDIIWGCLCRADRISEELIVAMKNAGCHTIQFGVETINEATLKAFEKPIASEITRYAFEMCKRHGVRTVGHFIFGLPGDSAETAKNTVDFAIELDCDFAAFNIAEAVVGTTFSELSYNEGWVLEGQSTPTKTQSYAYPKSGTYSFSDVAAWQRNAVLRFYFRPRYLLKRFADIRSFNDVKSLVENAVHLFRKYGTGWSIPTTTR